jgi:ABC-type multidrug transport system permease subunit
VVRDASRLLLVWLAALASAAVLLTVLYVVLLIVIGLLFYPNGIGPDD